MGDLVEFTGPAGPTRSVVAAPEHRGGPAVLVLHSGRVEDAAPFCDGLAEEGFTAVAPEFGDADLNTASAAIGLVLAQPGVEGMHAAVIAFGGPTSVALQLAASSPELVSSLVLFYGNPTQDEVDRLPMPVQVHYAANDPNRKGPAVQGGRPGAGVVLSYNYPGTDHGFLDPARPETLDSEPAQRAWERTLKFLHEHAAA